MPLQMPRPMKRSGSTSHHLVHRIPADVLPKAAGLTLSIPVGDETVTVTLSSKAKDVRVSLRTRDPQEARKRQAAAVAYLGSAWEAVRKGPRRLTHKETVALAGEAYAALVAAAEDDPGSAEGWVRHEVANLQAEFGQYGRTALKIGGTDAERAAASLEERFGSTASALLARRGLVVDKDSRARLLDQMLHADRQGALLNMRRAGGDYSPDPQAGRFPAFPETAKDTKAVSLMALFEGWAKERKPAASTVEQWRKHVEAFVAFIGKDDAGQMSKADVVSWKDALVAAGGAPKTINDSKLAALKKAFEWGAENVRIASNPATGVSVDHKVRSQDRMRGFTDDEAAAILKAASQETRPAIRWLPLLCASSGARVGEMAQLRRSDVFEKNGTPALRITADAGSVKTDNAERVVPIHPVVLAAGFLDFVETREGPLFYDPRRRSADAKKPPQKIVAKNVAAWVQGLGLSVGRAHRKDPSHAWRHRFTTVAREAGVADSVIEAIAGRAPDTTGKGYGMVTFATMVETLKRIPVPGHDALAASPSEAT